MEQHPQVVIELSINNRNVDLVDEGYDMAIRLGELADSGLAAKRLGNEPVCLVASPEYVRLAGAPRSLDELARHACLPFIMPSTGRQAPWLLQTEGKDLDWLAPARMLVTDDVLGVVSLAQQGLGICQTYHFVVEERLRSGQLVEVLPALRGRSRAFSLIYPPHRRMSAASRALIDALPSGC
jgi:DNA-binding transcriptional LysR family regulator